MGYPPNTCVVVEDSTVGVQAANAAGNAALHYVANSTEKSDDTAIAFSEMSQLPKLNKALETE